jgi:CIC family chloride channel protein
MGAVFAGIVRAPMTSVLMIFEMTQDYAVIVPLMIANMVSLFIASRLQHEPIYEALAEQDGIHLPSGARKRKDQRYVASIMQPASQVLLADVTIQQALERVQASGVNTWIVTDERGVVGLVTLARLQQETEADSQKPLADLLDVSEFPHVHSDQGLDLALERMGHNHADILPVVNRADIHKLEGIVTLHDVLDAYGVNPS